MEFNNKSTYQPFKLDIDETYRKLAGYISQISDIETESGDEYVSLIYKVDEWEEDEEIKQLDADAKTTLIGCVNDGIEMDKDVQHSFISHTLDEEKATLLKKCGPNPFVSDAIPKPTQVFVPEVTKKWAKKPGNNFKET